MIDKRGQGAIEYITIISAVLIVIAGFTISQLVEPSVKASRDSVYLFQAQSTADKIANSIDCIYTNAEGARITETVEFSNRWRLEIDENVRVGVRGENGGYWQVYANLRYNFEDTVKLTGIDSGSYFVIVEWSESEGESLDPPAENNRIHIYIDPEGG